MPPVVVIEGSAAAFERVTEQLAAAGWRVVDGFGREEAAGPKDVRRGAVTSPVDAGAALLAVLGGAGVAVHGLAPRDVLDRLIDDLRHIGPVEHRRAQADDGGAVPTQPPDADAIEILRILAEGRTLGDAALALGLSRRTADRRLAAARAALGAERTVEAVARARRLGWFR